MGAVFPLGDGCPDSGRLVDADATDGDGLIWCATCGRWALTEQASTDGTVRQIERHRTRQALIDLTWDTVLSVDLASTCEGPCPHVDCWTALLVAGTECTGCGRPIGGSDYVNRPGGDRYHADCWTDACTATPQTEAAR